MSLVVLADNYFIITILIKYFLHLIVCPGSLCTTQEEAIIKFDTPAHKVQREIAWKVKTFHYKIDTKIDWGRTWKTEMINEIWLAWPPINFAPSKSWAMAQKISAKTSEHSIVHLNNVSHSSSPKQCIL